MREYTLKLRAYDYNELTEQAKEQAYLNWKDEQESCNFNHYPYDDELQNTLDEFSRIFDINCFEWSCSADDYSYHFHILNDTLQDNKALTGIRLAKYIWNNYAVYLMQPITYYSKNSRKSRKSNIFHTMEDCPLTGVCYDTAVLDPIIKCLTYKKIYTDYRELVAECLDSLFEMAQDEQAYRLSREYFEETMYGEDFCYTEYGELFEMPDGADVTDVVTL